MRERAGQLASLPSCAAARSSGARISVGGKSGKGVSAMASSRRSSRALMRRASSRSRRSPAPVRRKGPTGVIAMAGHDRSVHEVDERLRRRPVAGTSRRSRTARLRQVAGRNASASGSRPHVVIVSPRPRNRRPRATADTMVAPSRRHGPEGRSDLASRSRCWSIRCDPRATRSGRSRRNGGQPGPIVAGRTK